MTTFVRRTLGTTGLLSAFVLATAAVTDRTFAQSTPVRMLVPELIISGETNDLTAAYSLVVAPNGNVIVFGRDEYRGKVFAPNGRLIRSFGRNGQGPGEIASSVIQNAGMVGDTLWINDTGARRIALFTSDGRRIREILFRRTPDPWQTGHPEWAWLNANLSPVRLLSGGAAIAVPTVGGDVVRSAVYPRTGQPLLRMTWEGKVTGAPLTLPLQNIFFRLPQITGNSFQQVLAHFPKYAFSANGSRLVIASVRDAARPYVELLHLSTTGDTIGKHQVPFTPHPISRRSVDSVVANWMAPMPADRRPPGFVPPGPRYVGHERELRDSLVVPRYFSPFSQVMLANDGTTWLRWHTPGNDRRWLLVSARGEVLMQVEQPPKSADIRVIDAGIWGAAADSVGFISLIRYAVREGR